MKNYVNVPSKSNDQKNLFFVGILKSNDENSRIRIHKSEAWIRGSGSTPKMSWIRNTAYHIKTELVHTIKSVYMSILHTRHDVAGFTIPLASCFCSYLYPTMKRLDQGHHHPKLEVPRLTCPSRESNPGLPGWEASTLEKSHSNSFLIQ